MCTSARAVVHPFMHIYSLSLVHRSKGVLLVPKKVRIANTLQHIWYSARCPKDCSNIKRIASSIAGIDLVEHGYDQGLARDCQECLSALGHILFLNISCLDTITSVPKRSCCHNMTFLWIWNVPAEARYILRYHSAIFDGISYFSVYWYGDKTDEAQHWDANETMPIVTRLSQSVEPHWGLSQYHGRQWNTKRHVRGANHAFTHFWRARQSKTLYRAESYKSRALSRITGNVETNETGNIKLASKFWMFLRTLTRILFAVGPKLKYIVGTYLTCLKRNLFYTRKSAIFRELS